MQLLVLGLQAAGMQGIYSQPVGCQTNLSARFETIKLGRRCRQLSCLPAMAFLLMLVHGPLR